MRFSDLNCFVDLRCFKQSSFYEIPLKALRHEDLLDFLMRIEMVDGKAARADAIHRLKVAGRQAQQNGWIDDGARLMPSDLGSMSDVSILISRFDRGERAAIMFALSEGTSLIETITLKRTDLRKRSLSPASRQIAERMPAHIHCEWLFWRECGGIAVPLSNLPGRWAQKMPISWEIFSKTFHQRWDSHYPAVSKQA